MGAHSDHLNSIVQAHILTEDFVDNIFYGHPTFDFFWDNMDVVDGTRLVEWSFYTTAGTLGQTIATFQDYMVKPESFAKTASLEWAHYSYPIACSKIEIAMTRGPTALVKYVEATVNRAKKSFVKLLSHDLLGDGLQYAHPDFGDDRPIIPMLGFQKIIAVDRSYAGHDSTDHPALDCYVVTISPAEMDNMYTKTDGSFLPFAMDEVLEETSYDQAEVTDLITTTKIMQSALKRAGYTDNMKLTLDHWSGDEDKRTAKMGYNAVEYDGKPVVTDIDVKGGHMYFTNSNTMYLAVLQGREMRFEPFDDSSDSDAVVANFQVSCQVIVEEPRKIGIVDASGGAGSTSRTIT